MDFIQSERALDMEAESLSLQLQRFVEESQELLQMMGDGESRDRGSKPSARTSEEAKSVDGEEESPSTPAPTTLDQRGPKIVFKWEQEVQAVGVAESITNHFYGPENAITKSDTPSQSAALEQVTFSAYHPREVQLQQWQSLIVYISLGDPATMAQVAAAAAERLAGKLGQFRPGRSEKSAELARGAKLRILPVAPGFEFNPSFLDITWQEDVQQHEMRLRAVSAQPGQAVNGVVQFYQGLLLRAEVPISIFVGQATAHLDSPDAYQNAIARMYRRIFASYSHADTPVVETCEAATHAAGDQYLRDVSLLQAGVQWDERLIDAINTADIFQLFWSRRAAASPHVEREWRHALQLLPNRPNFIRPVYWSRRLHPVPAELNPLHFQPLSLSSIGWGRMRTVLYKWFRNAEQMP